MRCKQQDMALWDQEREKTLLSMHAAYEDDEDNNNMNDEGRENLKLLWSCLSHTSYENFYFCTW